MEGLLLGLVVLACPVSMGVMMWFMAKGARRGEDGGGDPGSSLEYLRAEHRRLGAEIEHLQDGSRPLARVDRD